MRRQKKALMDHMDEESRKITDTEVEIRRQREPLRTLIQDTDS